MHTLLGKADIHLHTTYSDGSNSVEEVLRHVAQAGDLRVIAVTDHDTIAGALAARRLAPAYGVEVIVGEEVSTADGHLLALFIEHELPPGRPAAETIQAAHAQGGLCVAAHPYDWMVPSLGAAGMRARAAGAQPAWRLDGVETFNAGLLTQASNARAAAVAAELGLPACGGSDAHHLATIGRGYTLFPGRTAADLRAALIAGQTQAGGSFWGWPAVATATGALIRRELHGLIARTGRLRPSS